MKSPFLKVLGALLLFSSWSYAQMPPPGPPPGDEGPMAQGKRPDKEFRDKEGRMMRPEPILMAGDPRFQNMLLLATTPPDKLEEKVKNWPAFAEMSDERKEQMKKEMEGFRNRIFKAALRNAEETGITLSEAQKPEYVKRYWERRAKVETSIRSEVQERLKAAMAVENAALKKEFSAPAAGTP